MNTALASIWEFLTANGLTVSMLGLTGALVLAWILVDFFEEHFTS